MEDPTTTRWLSARPHFRRDDGTLHDRRMPARRPLLALALLIAPPAQAAARWTFEARLAAEDAPLVVSACSDRALPNVRFAAGEGAGRDLRAASRSAGGALEREGDALVARDWRAGECLRTGVDLVAAAERDRYGLGRRAGHFLRLAPQRWLWRPADIDPDSTIDFAELPADWSLSVPWRPVEGGFRLGDTPRDWPAVVVFGRLHHVTHVFDDEPAGKALHVTILPTVDAPTTWQGLRPTAIWPGLVAGDLRRIAGGLPRSVQIVIVPLPGVSEPVPWGETTRGGGMAIHLFIGADSTQDARRADWTAHHEFAHLLHPYLGERGRWLAEGLASYYQNVMRARGGSLSAAEAWSRLAAGFARGRAATPAGAQPLEQAAASRTRGSTMRVYWAGAAFWLESDLALRAGGSSLDALLGAFADEHGGRECCWTPESFIDALHALAPAAGFPARFRRHADGRTFPLSDAQVADWTTQATTAGTPIAGVLARHVAD